MIFISGVSVLFSVLMILWFLCSRRWFFLMGFMDIDDMLINDILLMLWEVL